MMPSVIPARLQFQCGHAALVTLPRVKGETATQRNDRVAREKSAALARQCDFCAPANGTNHAAPETSAAISLAESVPVAETLVAETLLPETLVPETLLAETAPETALSVEVAGTSPSETFFADASADGAPEVAAAEPSTPKLVRKPRARRQPSAAEVARGQRFLVEYRLERTLRADTIHDALRQLASFGAEDVVAITRED
jgi:hypothetical protein